MITLKHALASKQERLRLFRLVCPQCEGSKFRRSRRRNSWEWAISVLLLPFRCVGCGRRFFRLRLSPILGDVQRCEWENLQLIIECRYEHWRAIVYDAANCEVLYTAERMTVAAAKVAALDFALTHRHGPSPDLEPEAVAETLVWECDVGHAR
jgi:hypothetical protein